MAPSDDQDRQAAQNPVCFLHMSEIQIAGKETWLKNSIRRVVRPQQLCLRKLRPDEVVLIDVRGGWGG